MRGTITRLDHELGTSSLSSLKAAISAAEYSPLFSRSRKCTDATATESRAHCAEWDKARALLGAAEQREQLTAELARITALLRAAPVRESVDPQSEAITQALAFAGLAVEPRDVGYALVLLFALGIELMAAFGATWCGVRLPEGAPTERPARAAPRAAAEPVVAAAPADPLTAIVGDLTRSERPTPFKALYEMYEAACRATGAEPESRRAVGLALSRRFDKSKGGDAAYYARPRPAVVA